jgi:hypothetical protein
MADYKTRQECNIKYDSRSNKVPKKEDPINSLEINTFLSPLNNKNDTEREAWAKKLFGVR